MCTSFINKPNPLPRWATALGVALTAKQGDNLRHQICTHSGDYYDYCGGDMEWESEYEQELFLRDNGIEWAYIIVACAHHTKVWWEYRGGGVWERLTHSNFKITNVWVEVSDGHTIEQKRVKLSACELATFVGALGLNS